MSERVTRKMLDTLVESVNREAKPKEGFRYMIEYAYGQPVLALNNVKTLCGRNISPRCSKSQLATWIFAFLEGIRELHFNTVNHN